MATPTKDRITCHVLDTTKGQPARGVRVKLELSLPATPPSHEAHLQQHGHTGPGSGAATREFESRTDDDGRITAWLPYSDANASGEVPVYTLEDVLEALAQQAKASSGGSSSSGGGTAAPSTQWTLRFDTGAYFAAQGVQTFFPEVAVTFVVREGQHYHVPLLLSPFSYSTYRGS